MQSYISGGCSFFLTLFGIRRQCNIAISCQGHRKQTSTSYISLIHEAIQISFLALGELQVRRIRSWCMNLACSDPNKYDLSSCTVVVRLYGPFAVATRLMIVIMSLPPKRISTPDTFRNRRRRDEDGRPSFMAIYI